MPPEDAPGDASGDEVEEVEEVEDVGEAIPEPAVGGVAPPWYVARGDLSCTSLCLHEELLDLANFLRPSDWEVALRRDFAVCVEAAAKSLWPRSSMHSFGSSCMGLALPASAVDLSLGGAEAPRPTTALKHLAERMLERGDVGELELLQAQRPAMLRIQQRSTGLWAHVAVDAHDRLESTRLAIAHIDMFPAIIPLVYFLKVFLAQRELLDASRGGIGSYMLLCLVVSFLQRHPAVARPEVYAVTSCGHLLLDFFRHYGYEFRYGSAGLSLRDGGAVFDRAAQGWASGGQLTVCVESPVDPAVDVGAKSSKIAAVRAAFRHAYQALADSALARSTGAKGGGSLLAPRLLRVEHEVVAKRHRHLEHLEDPAAKRRRQLDPDSAAVAQAFAQAIARAGAPAPAPEEPRGGGRATAAEASIGGVLDALVAAGIDEDEAAEATLEDPYSMAADDGEQVDEVD